VTSVSPQAPSALLFYVPDSSAHPPVILILGPTAGGKTALSIALAQQLPGTGEIISADSMQVYKHMDIGTAKPAPEERRGIPHHLLDIVEPDEPFSVDDWLRLTNETIEHIRSRHRWPIIVGGTNLYVKVFLEGIFAGPPADSQWRAAAAQLSIDDLNAQLARLDPASASRIHRNDRKRITRAIEVFQSTGRPMSAQQTQWDSQEVRTDVAIVGLTWPREDLNRRINTRVKAMYDAGLVKEVTRLHAAGRLGPQAREALGYKQIIQQLKGIASPDDTFEQIKIETRRFARKQGTWLKRFALHPRSLWIDAVQNDMQAIISQALAYCLDPTMSRTP